MFSLNGSTSPQQARGLRWIWFGGSIIADWNNPVATTNRAVIRALQQRGQQVLYVEPSDHPAFHDALRARGSAMYRAFQDAYPDIHYRRETLPGGSEGDVWLSRETALADVLVVQEDAPAQILDWIGRVPASPIVRLYLSLSGELDIDPALFDLVLSPVQNGRHVTYGPAVLAETAVDGDRTGSLVVVYGGEPESGVEAVAAGATAPERLPFEAEARLAGRYRLVEQVTVYDDDASPFASARAMLAAAAGADVTLIRSGEPPRPANEWNDADQQVARLVDEVMAIRARRLVVQEESES